MVRLQHVRAIAQDLINICLHPTMVRLQLHELEAGYAGSLLEPSRLPVAVEP